MRKKILGLRKTRRSAHKSKMGGLNVGALFMGTGQLKDSIRASKLSLRIYAKSDILTDESQKKLFDFLMILNSSIREKAIKLESDLRVHFIDGDDDELLDTIVDESKKVATLKTLIVRCTKVIKFLERLYKLEIDANEIKDKQELQILTQKFDKQVRKSISAAEGLHIEVAPPAANVNMAAAAASAAPRSTSPSAKAVNANIGDLMNLIGRMKV